MYLLRAVSPQGNDYTPSHLQPVSVLYDPIVVHLKLTIPSVIGTVYAPDGSTPVQAWVNAYAAGFLVETRLAVGGAIKLGGLEPGTYMVQARRAPSDPAASPSPLMP